MKEGGFVMRKWISNCEKLMDKIEEDQADRYEEK